MRALIIGDLHGEMPNLPEGRFDLVIAPGDFGGDHGIRQYVWQAYRRYLDGEEVQWWEIPGRDEAKRLAEESIARGRAILKQLDSLGMPVLVVPGNWDWTGTNVDRGANMALFGTEDVWNELLLDGLRNVRDIAYESFDAGAAEVIGYGPVNGPELARYRGYDRTPEELAENEAAYAELQAGFDDLFAHAVKPVVLLAHNVPYGTVLDTIDNPESPRHGQHYGSNLVRYLCEKHQPLLCIGGHMHEHFGTDRIGDTVCINTGFGPEVHTIVEIVDGRIVTLEQRGKNAANRP